MHIHQQPNGCWWIWLINKLTDIVGLFYHPPFILKNWYCAICVNRCVKFDKYCTKCPIKALVEPRFKSRVEHPCNVFVFNLTQFHTLIYNWGIYGDKTIPDSAEPRLESFYPPFAAGIDLPHQCVADSLHPLRVAGIDLRQSRCCGFFVSFADKNK